MSNPINPKYPLYLKNIGGKFKTINVTHEELVDLRNDNKLIPGMQYRITDYVATTSDTESRSANHPFDIIVTADDTNILNENARAIQHEGDEYFKNCNLAAWKLKYCLNNDVNRFSWAMGDTYHFNVPDFPDILATLVEYDDINKDTEYSDYCYKFVVTMPELNIRVIAYTNTLEFISQNEDDTINALMYIVETGDRELMPIYRIEKSNFDKGKGVIYEMIDEYNNRAPYDFKGIQFKRYTGEDHNGNIIEFTHFDANLSLNYDKFVYSCTVQDEENFIGDENILDGTIKHKDYVFTKNFHIGNSYATYSHVMILPNIAIIRPLSYLNNAYIKDNCNYISIKLNPNLQDYNIFKDIINIGNDCNHIIINSEYQCDINIGSYCESLYNIYNCKNYLSHCRGYIDTRSIIIHNIDVDYVIELIFIPTELLVLSQITNKFVEVWKNEHNLSWYHPDIGLISGNLEDYIEKILILKNDYYDNSICVYEYDK